MKKFILNSLMFSLPILLLMYPLDILLSRFYSSQDDMETTGGEYQIWNLIYEGGVQKDILIYGSSRAGLNINNNLFTDSFGLSTYNLGDFGNLFPTTYLRHLVLKRYNALPQMIILSVGIETFRQQGTLFHSQQFCPYMLWDSAYVQQTYRFDNFRLIDYYLPLVRYMGDSKYIYQLLKVKGAKFPAELNGYRPKEQKWKAERENQDAMRVGLDSSAIHSLENFLHEMKQKNVQVVMVLTPYHISGANDIAANPQVFKFYEDITREHGIPYLNYLTVPMSADTSCFIDITHLSQKGATQITQQIMHDLDSMQLMPTPRSQKK